MVQLFNFWHIFFIFLVAGTIVGAYFLLRSTSEKTKRVFLASLLFFNLILHFLKPTFPPYSTDPALAMREVWFTNLCGTSVLFFPFVFLSKGKTGKDYMVFLGIISGFLATLYPTEALGESVLSLDLWRFYICHGILIAVPILTVLFKLHTLDVRRIPKVPLWICAMLLFIICNQVLQSELGIIPLRDGDMLDVNFRNPSLIWGPTDDVAVLFSWLTPSFMKTVPVGPYAGQEKYWPFFWMLPGVILYFTLLPLLICFIFDFKRTKEALIAPFAGLKTKTKKKTHP